MTSTDCPFCAIAKGLDDTVEMIGHGETWVAFFPDAPATTGHTLVIPRQHIRHLWEAPPEIAESLMSGVVAVGRILMRVLKPDGMNLITSAGVAAEQSIPHLHLHVVPRWHADRIGPIWPPKRRSSIAAESDLAERVRREWALHFG